MAILCLVFERQLSFTQLSQRLCCVFPKLKVLRKLYTYSSFMDVHMRICWYKVTLMCKWPFYHVLPFHLVSPNHSAVYALRIQSNTINTSIILAIKSRMLLYPPICLVQGGVIYGFLALRMGGKNLIGAVSEGHNILESFSLSIGTSIWKLFAQNILLTEEWEMGIINGSGFL